MDAPVIVIMSVWISHLFCALYHIATACCQVVGKVRTNEKRGGDGVKLSSSLLAMSTPGHEDVVIRRDVSFIEKLERTYHKKANEMLNSKCKI